MPRHSSVVALESAARAELQRHSVGREAGGADVCDSDGRGPCNQHTEPLLPELCAESKDLKALQQRLHAAALAYVPVSHLMWALWGIIQVHTSDVSFDFEAYARQRLEQFFKTSAHL